MIAIPSVVAGEKAEHKFREVYKCYRGNFRKFLFSHEPLKAESSAKSEDEDGDVRGLERGGRMLQVFFPREKDGKLI